MSTQLFESALGIKAPWSVRSVDFDEAAKRLTVQIDFEAGTRFAVSGHAGEHPVHDTVTKTYRHLNFFQHECHLQVRVPRVRLPHGAVRQIDPDFAGRLNGFTLLFEALILMLAQQMPFRAVGRIVGESEYRVLAVCRRYVHIAGGLADYSAVTSLAIDETSRARGHQYVTIAADADERRVVFVGEGRGAQVVAELAEHLDWHSCPPSQIRQVELATLEWVSASTTTGCWSPSATPRLRNSRPTTIVNLSSRPCRPDSSQGASTKPGAVHEAVAVIEHDEPQIQIELVEMPSYDQVRALTAGALDLGFAHTMLAPEGLASLTLYSEPLVACLSRDHRLARRQAIELGELQRERFIIFSRAASPAYFDRILSLCVEAGFTPNIRHQIRQLLTVVSMTSKGLGVAIVPASLADSGVPAAFMPLKDAGAILTIQCMWLPEQETPLLRKMLGYVQDHVSAKSPKALVGN
jgi:hypothetical protein